MHSNTGRFGNNASVSAVNAENIEDLFEMNFNRDGYSCNNKGSSLYDLTRIQPQACWSTNHLLMRLWDDLPEGQKSSILFVKGSQALAEQESENWLLKSGAVEYKTGRIVLTSLPQGEGVVTLKNADAEDVQVSVDLQGNKIGTQTIYLRANEERSRCIMVSLQNDHLVVSEKDGGSRSDLFELDLHDLVPAEERISVEEDDRDALTAEYTMRGRFADSAADSLVFYAAARKAGQQQADTVAQGAEEYVADIQINEQGDTNLKIQLQGDTLRVLVNGEDVTGAVDVSVQDAGGIALGASWGGWGYSQRNVADDVYDGVFKNLTITAGDITLYDNCLHGWAKVLDVIQNAWNATLNWFIENL